MSYVGGIIYVRTSLQEAMASTASGKGKQLRPPVSLNQTDTTRPHGASRLTSPTSKASDRSSAYSAVQEAAVALRHICRNELASSC